MVTIGALIGMASHMENKGVSVLDQVGVAQKGGAVLSHIRVASTPEKIHSVKVGKTSADLILGCDMVVVTTSPVRELMNINRTHSILNDHETPVAGFSLDLGHFKTDVYYSRTTSKHINQYFKHVDKVREVPQQVIVNLCHPEGVAA